MSIAIAKIPTASILPGLTEDQVKLIKRTICKGATDDELALFIATANRLGLDPFARQIFAVKRKEKRGESWIDVMSIQVSIDGFRLVADRTGRYTPGSPTKYEHDSEGRLVCATAYVKKHSHGEWHEVPETAYYEEYVQTNRDKQPNAMWGRMPRVMLAKCAEARALRRAFPAELSGVYEPAEMDQADNPTPSYRAAGTAPKALPLPEDDERLLAEFVNATSIDELNAIAKRAPALDKEDPRRIKLGRTYKARLQELEDLKIADEAATFAEEGEAS